MSGAENLLIPSMAMRASPSRKEDQDRESALQIGEAYQRGSPESTLRTGIFQI